jgi:multidrug efflux pump subunit AcrA (membrane-fusion protein)
MKPAKQIALPGELKPWNKVSIHPKIKGFVKTVNADRGTMVRKGQVLAVLEAPEVISELSQAKAQVIATEAALQRDHDALPNQRVHIQPPDPNQQNRRCRFTQ